MDLLQIGTEYDSQATLAELDRGLRSENVGERCEMLVKIPAYFSHFPFPMFINAAFLKVADVFKNGSNMLRRRVVLLAERVEDHLDKIISHDEAYRRIVTVSHSNDPVARALTVQLLGWLAPLFADRKEVHHLLLNCLDSRDPLEKDAALFATRRYAQQSNAFAEAVIEKLTDVLLNVEIPLTTKLHLLPVFGFTKNKESATKLFRLCKEELVDDAPSEQLTIAVFAVLTALARQNVLQPADQVNMLLETLRSSRKRLKIHAMKNLLILSDGISSTVWTAEHFEILCPKVFDSKLDLLLAELQLQVMAKVFRKHCQQLDIRVNSRIVDLLWQVCTNLTRSDCLNIALRATQLTGNLCISLGVDGQKLHSVRLDSLMALLSAADSFTEEYLVQLLCSEIWNCAKQQPENSRVLLNACCTASVSTGKKSTQKALIVTITSIIDLYPDMAPSISDWALETVKNGTDIYALVNTLLPPRALNGNTSGAELIRDSFLVGNVDQWQVYTAVRAAMRNGYHSLAAHLLVSMTFVGSPSYRQYLDALRLICEAESKLDFVHSYSANAIAECSSSYLQAVYKFQAVNMSISAVRVPWFLEKLCRCRLAFLQAIESLTVTCNSAKVTPPPISEVDNRSARFRHKLSLRAADLRNVGDEWLKLRRQCFDADHNTLSFLSLHASLSHTLAKSVSRLSGVYTAESDIESLASTGELNACNKLLLSVVQWVNANLDQLDHQSTSFNENGKELLDFLLEICLTCLKQPLYFPRFFFQRLQRTELKLQLSSEQQTAKNIHTLMAGPQAILKLLYKFYNKMYAKAGWSVEGVLDCHHSRKLRHVCRVIIDLRYVEYSADKRKDTDYKGAHTTSGPMSKSIELKKNYFCEEFLLSQSGIVEVEADLVDADGQRWNSGSKMKHKITVHIIDNSRLF